MYAELIRTWYGLILAISERLK